MVLGQTYQRHILLLGFVIIVAGLIAASDALHSRTSEILMIAEAVIAESPVLGMLLFTLLAMASAMLAFFSSALIVPIGIYAWGSAISFVLLWVGWFLGGILAFAIGRYFGRAAVTTIFGERRVETLERRLGRNAKFIHVLLFQAAVPSEIPGYLLGSLRYRLTLFAAALALAELPYALGTVFIGASFLNRDSTMLIVLGLLGVVLTAGAYLRLREKRRRRASVPRP